MPVRLARFSPLLFFHLPSPSYPSRLQGCPGSAASPRRPHVAASDSLVSITLCRRNHMGERALRPRHTHMSKQQVVCQLACPMPRMLLAHDGLGSSLAQKRYFPTFRSDQARTCSDRRWPPPETTNTLTHDWCLWT
ncbi:hypothetical protein EV126DRAFT_425268 [Verticillium dahliae]|nr:hypothetical protein EV126DRAFT_425268 [Verticillium dahliae]